MNITVHNISKIYTSGAKEIRAVDGVSLNINKGESIAVLGPSGAGKSTLLHMIGGLDKPTEGDVFLGEHSIYRTSDSDRAGIRNKNVGFVFQFYHLLPEFTALENVLMPGLMSRELSVGGRELKRRAEELLGMVGLTERAGHRPSELSGGESQRVAVARALMNSPQFLLCDEPTGNLDSNTSDGILELLFNLKEGLSMALVIVTHDERITKRTDRTVRMRDGRIER